VYVTRNVLSMISFPYSVYILRFWWISHDLSQHFPGYAEWKKWRIV